MEPTKIRLEYRDLNSAQGETWVLATKSLHNTDHLSTTVTDVNLSAALLTVTLLLKLLNSSSAYLPTNLTVLQKYLGDGWVTIWSGVKVKTP